jgi:hypothetical protein
MASSYTTGFSLEKIGSGEQSGAWGDTTNFNWDIVDRLASYKAVAITTNADAHTLTVREAAPDSNTENLQDGMYRVIKFTGSLDSNCTVTIAPNTTPAWFIVNNATSGSSASLIFTQGTGANITVENGKTAIIYCDGGGSDAAVIDAISNLATFGDITVSGTFNALGDTAASDKAAFGYTSVLGAIITGQGSTNDVTLVNDADATVLGIATGTTNVDIVGDVTASTVNADGATAADDKAAMGYTSADGLVLTGQGSTSDITFKNDAAGTVFTVPTGTDDILFPDDAKAMWGTGSDMTVHWDGTDGHLTVAGTLNIDGSGETMATFVDDGAVTLYHNNVVKVATSANGVSVTGTLLATTSTATGQSGTVVLDFSTNQNFVLTIDGNITLGNPSTEQVGQSGVIVFIQDGGDDTLSLGSQYKTVGDAGITLSTADGAVDIIPYFVSAADSILLGAVQLALSGA